MFGYIIAFLVLLILSGSFSMTETVMLSLSDLQVKAMVKRKIWNAHLIAKIKEDPHLMLRTILVGNNVVNILAASLATKLALDAFGNEGVAIATGVVTFIVLLFGEIIPKQIGVSHAPKIAPVVSLLLYGIEYLLFPLTWLFGLLAKIFVKLLGEPERTRITQEEVKEVIRASELDGHLKKREREMIHNVLKLDDRKASEVMTPRLDVFCLEMHTEVDAVIDRILEEGFSRVPVFDTRMDQMRGVVIVKELLKALHVGKKRLTLEDVMQPVLFVPENKPLDSLLREFQRRQSVLAIVVDEHGLFIGIITIEDVLEELVGEIYDEDDEQSAGETVQIDEKTLLTSGRALIPEINEQYGLTLPDTENYDTVAGLVMHKFGRIPRKGDTIKIPGYALTAEKVLQHRIVQVRIVKVERSKRQARPRKA